MHLSFDILSVTLSVLNEHKLIMVNVCDLSSLIFGPFLRNGSLESLGTKHIAWKGPGWYFKL